LLDQGVIIKTPKSTQNPNIKKKQQQKTTTDISEVIPDMWHV
jgi:hypothetical protein